MNKRKKKKRTKNNDINFKKNLLCDSSISPYICPICGRHTIKLSDKYLCSVCRRQYEINELGREVVVVSFDEKSEIIAAYSNHLKSENS